MNFFDSIYEYVLSEVDEVYNTPIGDFPPDTIATLFGDIDTYERIKLMVCDELTIGLEEFKRLPYITIIGVMTYIAYKLRRNAEGW